MKKNELAEEAYKMLIEGSRKLAILYYESGRYVDAAASWSEVVDYALKLDLLEDRLKLGLMEDETEKPEPETEKPERWKKGDVLANQFRESFVVFNNYSKMGSFYASECYDGNSGWEYNQSFPCDNWHKAASNIETPSASHVGRKAVILRSGYGIKAGKIDIIIGETEGWYHFYGYSVFQSNLYLLPETEKPEPEQWDKGDVLLAKNGDLVLFESYDKNGLNFTAQLIYAKNPPVLGSGCWLVPSFKKAVSNIETPSVDHVGRKAVVLGNTDADCEKGDIAIIRFRRSHFYATQFGEIHHKDLYLLPETEKPEPEPEAEKPEKWDKGDVLELLTGPTLVAFDRYKHGSQKFYAKEITRNAWIDFDGGCYSENWTKAVSNIETPSRDHVGREAVVLAGENKGKVGIIEDYDYFNPIGHTYYIDSADEFINTKNLYLLPETD